MAATGADLGVVFGATLMQIDQHGCASPTRRRAARYAVAGALALTIASVASLAPAQSPNEQGVFGKVIRIDKGGFKPSAGLITFSEFAVGTRNPSYGPHSYGGDSRGVSVQFGGFFVGQRIGDRSTCRGAVSGCVVGEPSGPLMIDPASPATLIAADSSSSTSPVLSGSPKFNGPVSMRFEPSVAGVGLVGGHFNAMRGTAIRAFDRNGRQIGGVVNTAIGMEYMALVTEDGSETIAGLQFSLVGPEPFGFAVDSISFARRAELQESSRPAGRGRSLGELFKGGGTIAPSAAPDAVSGETLPAARSPSPPPSGRSLKELFK